MGNTGIKILSKLVTSPERLSRRHVVGLFGASALFAACGGDSSPGTEEAATATSTQPPVSTAVSPEPAVSTPSRAVPTVTSQAPATIDGPQRITSPAARTPGRVVRNLLYVEGGDDSQRLDLYFSTANLRPAPLAIFVHGGGFFEGDKAGIGAPTLPPFFVLTELLSRGYVVASLNYRLSGVAAFPAAVEDCKAAVRYLRANAARFAYFPGRVVVFGASAGGNLASMLGVTVPADGLEGSGGDARVSSRVQAVANLYGLSDFKLGLSGGAEEQVQPYLGTTSAEREAVKDRASPVTYVTSDDAPFLHIHGDRDQVAPLIHSEGLHQRLGEAGVQSELIVVKNAGHSLVSVGGEISPSMEEVALRVSDFFDAELMRV